MKGGSLKQRVTIQEAARTTDGQGGFEEPSWKDFATVWADVKPISSSTRFETAMLWPTASHTVVVRYLTGIRSTMRVVFGQRIFSISGVINEGERNIQQRLICEEQPA